MLTSIERFIIVYLSNEFMETDRLLEVGFTKNEAKIYLVLLRGGPLQAGETSKRTQINRRTTYDTIERLIEKGFVSYSIVSNRRLFKATNPEILLTKIKEMEKQAREIVPNLKQLFIQSREEQETDIYEGRKGIRSILDDILKQKEYVVFGSNEKFPAIMQHDFSLFQKRKKELKIKSRTIMSISMKGEKILKEGFTDYRFIPEEYSLPTSTFIYGNKTAIVVWSELPVGMVIENKEVSDSFGKYFDVLWKTAQS